MRAYRIEWNVEPEDLFILHIKTNRSLRVSAVLLSAVIALLVVWSFLEQLALPLQALLFLLIGMGSFLSLSLLAQWGGRFLLKKRREPLPTAVLTIDEDGIKSESEASSYHIKWERVQNLEELNNYLLIQTKKQEKMIIPKRCFQNAEEEEACIAFIKSHS